MRQKDRLLFFPFDGVDPFLQLLEEAAARPDVVSIRITIYRLATADWLARFFRSLLMRLRMSSPLSSSSSASRFRSAFRVTHRMQLLSSLYSPKREGA